MLKMNLSLACGCVHCSWNSLLYCWLRLSLDRRTLAVHFVHRLLFVEGQWVGARSERVKRSRDEISASHSQRSIHTHTHIRLHLFTWSIDWPSARAHTPRLAADHNFDINIKCKKNANERNEYEEKKRKKKQYSK